MGHRIVFLIRSNPNESHRPAEAVRIAAGLGIGKNPVKIILSGDALRMLSPDEEDMIDTDIIEKFLPLLQEWNIPLYVDKQSSGLVNLKDSSYNYRVADIEEISELIAGGHSVFVF